MIKITKELKKLLENQPVSIATCTFDKPNISVAAYLRVLDDGRILITDNYMAITVKNIQKNKKIELAVWGLDWIGYKISGTAVYENTGHWLDFVQAMPENDKLPAKGAILVTVENVKKIGD
jgi:predicted pyridoxine 5'-phosphate oxidase superfamily flavin-nucleotide-binding protein